MKVMSGAPHSVSGSCFRDLETGTASEKLSVHASRIHTSSLAAGEPKHNAVASMATTQADSWARLKFGDRDCCYSKRELCKMR